MHSPSRYGRRPRGRPQDRRRWIPLALLLLSLAIAGYAVHRGQSALRSQRATAEALLRDYGTFAAWSFSRHAGESLEGTIRGVLYPLRFVFLSTDDAEPCLEELHEAATLGSECGCGDPIGGRFTFVLRIAPRQDVSQLVGTAPDAAEWDRLAGALTDHARSEYQPQWPFAVLHVRADVAAQAEVILAYTRLSNASGDTVLYGFEIDRARLAAHLDHVFRRPDLLPPSLTHELPNDALLAIHVESPTGRSLFGEHPRHDRPAGLRASRAAQQEPQLAAAQPLVDALGGGTVRAGVLPSASGLLIIGGLPSSQLPWLLLVFALSGALALIAVSQLRREGQLATLRSDFVSSVSHELRTPLAQVRLFLETLRLGRYDTDAQRDWILASIDRETKRLVQLVDNVLQFTRAERGVAGAVLRPTEIGGELREIVVAFEPLAASRRARLALDIDAPVYASIDRQGFRQVVLNLLDNAIKYGPLGQTVTVRLRAAGPRARVEVDDEGSGVELSERRAIWEPFRRGERAVGSVAVGSGIGLAVVREIIGSHGGVVSVVDAPSGGARFVVELPRMAEPQAAMPVPRERGEPVHGAVA